MVAADSPSKHKPDPDILRTVVLAYHTVTELMRPKQVLDTIRVIRVANGVLDRLRRAWREMPVFLAALADLEHVASKQPKSKAESDAINQEIQTLLVVLKAGCRSFLESYAEPEKRYFGFLEPEEDES